MSLLREAVIAATALAAVSMAGHPAAASSADTFFCTGEVADDIIDATLVVPPEEFCIILRTTVRGDVIVPPGAIGFHAHTSHIGGSVKAVEPQLDVRVLDTHVGGDVAIAGTLDGTVGAICRSEIRGDVRLVSNAGDMFIGDTGFGGVCRDEDTIVGNVGLFFNSGYVLIRGETVLGDIRVGGNTGTEELLDNHVLGSLWCRYNSPPPVVTGNLVLGSTVGQCADAS